MTGAFFGGYFAYTAWERAWDYQTNRFRENATYVSDQMWAAKLQRSLGKVQVPEAVAAQQDQVHLQCMKLQEKAEKYTGDWRVTGWGYGDLRRNVAMKAHETLQCAVSYADYVAARKPLITDGNGTYRGSIDLTQKLTRARVMAFTDRNRWFKLHEFNKATRELADAIYEVEH